MHRRGFLKKFSASAATVFLATSPLTWTACSARPANRRGEDLLVPADLSPIDRADSTATSTVCGGDDPTIPHEVLWQKQAFLASAKQPEKVEQAPLVIVGGGMSGLLTAYLLRDLNPIVLEQASRFGGNSKAESWSGIDYSIGAAYFLKPDAGSAWEKLVSELGVDEMWQRKVGGDPVALGSQVYGDFWKGTTSRGDAMQFHALESYFKNTWEGVDGEVYPEIPFRNSSMRTFVETLDAETFHEHVKRKCGGKLPEHIETVLEHYCWSTFGGSSAEISAAAGINNFAAEFGEVVVTPGGNAAVAERVLQRILKTVDVSRLRSRSLVVDVKKHGDGNSVLYLDAERRLKQIQAKAVVMACPKFVAKRLIDDLDRQRLDAISKITYRAYLVANVFLKRAPEQFFYDLYMLGDGKVDVKNVMATSARKRATDIVLANFAYGSANADRAILTLYRGFPYDGGRAVVYNPQVLQQYRREFEQQIDESILPMLGLQSSDVAGMRMARWGHPMPVPKKGVYTAGVPAVLRRPHRDSVFFIEQDNWLLPAIETCAEEALSLAPAVRDFLRSRG